MDFGELLAGRGSRSKRKTKTKTSKELDGLAQDIFGAQDKAVQTSTSTPKAVVSCDSPGMSSAPSPPVARRKISKQNVLTNQPQHDITTPPVGTSGKKLDKSILSSRLIQYPYIYDRPERIIPEEYLLSPEITRLAQLPRYTYDAISAQTFTENEHANYDITSSGADAGDDALQVFYKLSKRTMLSYRQTLFALDRLLRVIRSAKTGYKPVLSETELLGMLSEIRMMHDELSGYSHEARRVLRHRRQSIRYLQLSREFPFSKEASSHYIKLCQALEPIEQLHQSRHAIARAMVSLRDFYTHRQTDNPTERGRALSKQITSHFYKMMITFERNNGYGDVIFKRFRPGQGPLLAYKVGQSLSQLGVKTKSLRELQTMSGNAARSRVRIPHVAHRNLENALYEYYEFETYKAARRNAIKVRARRLHQEREISKAKYPIYKIATQERKISEGKHHIYKFASHESKITEAKHPIYKPARPSKQDKQPPNSVVLFRVAQPASPGNQDEATSDSMVFFRAAIPSRSPGSAAPGSNAPSPQRDARNGTPELNPYTSQHRLPRDSKAKSMLTKMTVNSRSFSGASNGGLDKPDAHIESTDLILTKGLLQGQAPASHDDSSQVLSSTFPPVNSKTSDASGIECSPATVAPPTYSSQSPKGYSMNQGVQRSDDTTPQKPVYWSYALYIGPKMEKVKVHYCKNKSDTERIAQLFLGQEVLGFDIEWKPNAQAKDGVKKNVSLIQIASEERVALFHIARYPDSLSTDSFVSPTLKAIMESQDITKVGVAIKGDCTRLRRFMGIESRGLFELSHLYKLVKFSGNNASSVNKLLVRLATQVEEHLGLPLSKGDARTSDWSLDLNIEQVQYAASDSYAGFQLFHTLEHKRNMLSPTPPRPYHAELNLPIRLATGQPIETDDESNSVEEEEPEILETGTNPTTEELARDFMKIAMACPVLPTAKTTMRSPKPGASQCKAEVTAANEWVARWRTTLAQDYKPTAAPACLRAYALWHTQGLSVPEAAGLLREPPLLDSTVAGYVLDALRAEKLPFEHERLAALHSYVPQAAKDRYRRFLEKAGVVIG